MTKILAIEDEAHVLEIIWEILEAEDFKVIQAENGLVGVTLAKKERPDLIICDVMMPGMDGFNVLKQLRSQTTTETIPFIFLTAKVTKQDRREGMDLGADDYLTKPFTRDELLKAVNSRLKKHAKLKQQSEEKFNDLRHNLTRTLPHELLTPLNGILGLADFMIEDCEQMKPSEIQETLKDIQNSGERLYQLIQNFLLYAQLELVANEPSKIKGFLSGNTASTYLTINAATHETAKKWDRLMDLHLKLEDVFLTIDEDWLKKIVSELVDNAFKFSKPGEPVNVTNSFVDGNFILSVSDRGRGMTPEQIANVGGYIQFERKLYEQQGSGLGLAISKQLTELYEGKFTIESIPGEQTTVTVSLPVSN